MRSSRTARRGGCSSTRVYTNTCAQNYKFTGLERDPESGLDETRNRMYSSNLGRWLEVDPVRGDVSNPQTLNRYPYVADNPTTRTDRLGLDGEGDVSEPTGGYLSVPGVAQPSCYADADVLAAEAFAAAAASDSGKDKKTPTCTATQPPYIPIPLGGYPAGNLCAHHKDHPYFWWSWTCEGGPGSRGCCQTQENQASKNCDKLGKGFYLEDQPSGMIFYANCCGPTPRREPPPKP